MRPLIVLFALIIIYDNAAENLKTSVAYPNKLIL